MKACYIVNSFFCVLYTRSVLRIQTSLVQVLAAFSFAGRHLRMTYLVLAIIPSHNDLLPCTYINVVAIAIDLGYHRLCVLCQWWRNGML